MNYEQFANYVRIILLDDTISSEEKIRLLKVNVEAVLGLKKDKPFYEYLREDAENYFHESEAKP